MVLNSLDTKIQYTVENAGSNGTLAFLDISISNNRSGRYEFSIYRKEAITNLQISPTSSVDPSTVIGVFKGFLTRAHRICSPMSSGRNRFPYWYVRGKWLWQKEIWRYCQEFYSNPKCVLWSFIWDGTAKETYSEVALDTENWFKVEKSFQKTWRSSGVYIWPQSKRHSVTTQVPSTKKQPSRCVFFGMQLLSCMHWRNKK